MSRPMALVQARMNSTRFPGKVLHPVCGKALLDYLLESLEKCVELSGTAVLTSDQPSDRPLIDFCQASKVRLLRGPLDDVAARFLLAVESFNLDSFVRISGDSPLLDHRLVDRAVRLFRENEVDLATNVGRRTFPKGQSVEVIRAEAFVRACREMKDPADREHVTPYFYRRPDEFRILNFEAPGDHGRIQLSVDTAEDMVRFENLALNLDRPHWEYTWQELLERGAR